MKRIFILAAAAAFLIGCSSPFQKESGEQNRQSTTQSASTEMTDPAGIWECEAFSVRYPDRWSVTYDLESHPNQLILTHTDAEDSQAAEHGSVLIATVDPCTGSPAELAECFAGKEDSEEYGLHYTEQATGECEILGYDACYGEYLLSSELAHSLSEENYTPSKQRVCYVQAGDKLFQILLIATSGEAFDALVQEANTALQLTISE